MRSISRLIDLPIVIQRAILVSAIPAAQRAAPDSLRALGALLTAQIFGQKNRRNSNDRKDKTKQPPTKSSSALFLRHQRRDNPKQSQYKEGVKEMICRKCHCTSPLTVRRGWLSGYFGIHFLYFFVTGPVHRVGVRCRRVLYRQSDQFRL